MTNAPLTPEVYRAAAQLFEQALDSGNPAAFLATSAAPSAVVSEAQRLLNLHESASANFLDAPIERARYAWFAQHFPPGTLLASRYRIIRLLGEGGMGEVYLAQDEALSQAVALKTLRAHLADDPIALERFRREVLVLRELHHPNVMRIFDFGRDDNLYFYTMEFLEGETLATRIKSKGPLSHEQLFTLADDLLAALAAVHGKGILHRDLKPSNIFLRSSPSPSTGTVLMDFGIATSQDQSTLTDAQSVLGSLDYMSPEQLEGRPLTPRSDYYSFALVLYEAASGQLAYSGTTPVARAFRRLNEPTHSIPQLPNPTFAPLNRAIAACLNKDPSARPPHPEAIRAILAGRRSLASWLPAKLVIAALLFCAFTFLSWRFYPRSTPANAQLTQHLKLASQFAARRTADDLANARQEFESALKIDPDNAETWTGLAEVHSTIANFGFEDPKPTLARAEAAARRALELAPNSGTAQAVQAYIVSLDLAQWRRADPLFRRAVDLDPNQTRIRLWYGAYLTKLGRFSEAFAQLQAGLQVDPASMALHQQLITIHSCKRDFAAAIQASLQLVRLHPREPSSHMSLCNSYLLSGQLDQARAACDQAVGLNGGPSSQAMSAIVMAAQGQTNAAKRILEQIRGKVQNLAIIVDLYSRLGQEPEAMKVLQEAYRRGDSSILYLAYGPRFDGIRQNPDFRRIASALGF